jgi:DNA-directed RNA polymerase specialized sigma24 family protein
MIHLKIYEGLTFAEIAEPTGASPNTAASRYRYAINTRREQLQPGEVRAWTREARHHRGAGARAGRRSVGGA